LLHTPGVNRFEPRPSRYQRNPFGELEGTVLAPIYEAELWRSVLAGNTLAGGAA
jgi:hypothetical protein